jgi:hypothetical protein
VCWGAVGVHGYELDTRAMEDCTRSLTDNFLMLFPHFTLALTLWRCRSCSWSYFLISPGPLVMFGDDNRPGTSPVRKSLSRGKKQFSKLGSSPKEMLA